MENLIQNTRNQDGSTQYKIVIYGQAGIGKSSIIPTINNPLVILVEDGNALISLKGVDIPFIKVNSFAELLQAFEYFKNDTRFNTIVIDSLSEASLSHVQDLLKGKSNSGKKIHGQQAYGQMIDDFDTLFDVINQCRQDIVCFAKQMRFVSDDGVETFYPMFAGKSLAPIVQHKFDAIVSMEKDEKGNRYFRTTSNYKYFAKVRTFTPLLEKEETNITNLINKIRGI